MNEYSFGTWGTYQKPEWEIRLENTSDYIIEKTGMSRKRLEELLEYLYEEKVIQ